MTPEDYSLIRKKIKANSDEVLAIINKSKPTYEEAMRVTMGQVFEKIEFKVEGDKLC